MTNSSDSLIYQAIENALINDTASYPAFNYETRWGLQYLVSSNLPSLTPAAGYEHAKTLALADAAFAAGDYGTFLSLSNSFSPANTLESNRQSINTIRAKLQSDTLNGGDLSTLQSVAQQCPQSGGSIVWTARTILTNYYLVNMDYPDGCPVNTGGGERVTSIQAVKATPSNTITLYPNPTNGKLYLSNFSANQTSAYIEVTDVAGKLIAKQQSQITAGLVELNLDATSGIYFVKVVNPLSGNTQVQKVIITK